MSGAESSFPKRLRNTMAWCTAPFGVGSDLRCRCRFLNDSERRKSRVWTPQMLPPLYAAAVSEGPYNPRSGKSPPSKRTCRIIDLSRFVQADLQGSMITRSSVNLVKSVWRHLYDAAVIVY